MTVDNTKCVDEYLATGPPNDDDDCWDGDGDDDYNDDDDNEHLGTGPPNDDNDCGDGDGDDDDDDNCLDGDGDDEDDDGNEHRGVHRPPWTTPRLPSQCDVNATITVVATQVQVNHH